MKKLFYLLMLGLTLIVTQTSLAGDRSYVMVCRGGGEMVLTIWPDSSGIVAEIRARGGTVGASQRPPNLGECTWVDRGMRPYRVEGTWPNIRFQGELDALGYLHLHIDKSVVGNQTCIKDITIQNGKENLTYKNDKIKYLVNAVKNGQLFYVRARRLVGVGDFKVTHVGP